MRSAFRSSTEHLVVNREGGKAPPKRIRSWLIGQPLSNEALEHQTISKTIGLAVFASDALSSTAYATQEILFILAAAGTSAFFYSIPISIAIVVLLAIVTVSYVQTIYAYPMGGGTYTVSRDNLGKIPSQIAGAAILTDYVLTVSVSISSGVSQITSAFPGLYDKRVTIAVAMVLAIMTINLRGLKESGKTFAIPTYYFLVMMGFTLVAGFVRYFCGTLGMVTNPPEMEMVSTTLPLSAFLILHAFSSGTTALTGVEAVSNGIPSFREPRSHNAAITLVWMSLILGVSFLGISILSYFIGAVPSERETVISQLARTAFGSQGPLYLATIAATSVILIMAANTAFADFPRLSAIMASDGFLPRQLTFRGSRLVFSRGIIVLSFIAICLIVTFDASVSGLIPLYAIGVFVSFTFSQFGMALRWKKCGQLKPGEELKEQGSTLTYKKNWRSRMLLNGFGSALTAVVTLVFAITKFADGAWVVLVLIPAMATFFELIHSHYERLRKSLSLEGYADSPTISRHRVLLLVSGVHRSTLQALKYAKRLSNDLTAVHVNLSDRGTTEIQKAWQEWGDGVRLVVVSSPYRLMLEPLLDYIDELDSKRQPNEILTIVVPHFVPSEWWRNAMHTQTAFWLRSALLFRPGIVITEVPYIVD